ncbi:hypothetical protein KGQ20_22900 [Catenulispora sp. NF23]|uniref:Uncharacterized protein n=1 Tax=Catenulispora pinistramenti TaxID=2705254 RepID=A0ABS5KX33_9ACTN|nr:hypothetical protein [Catenulispora pinistramenti]MBS2535614.1 hypothetical protein [Catenulispora pinistramenti]MBS2550515.1 hypothetical protein [Catenulispora pinistramenti]
MPLAGGAGCAGGWTGFGFGAGCPVGVGGSGFDVGFVGFDVGGAGFDVDDAGGVGVGVGVGVGDDVDDGGVLGVDVGGGVVEVGSAELGVDPAVGVGSGVLGVADGVAAGVASARALTTVATEEALTMVDTATPAISRRRTRRALAFFDMENLSTSCRATLRRTSWYQGVSGQ